MADAEGMVRGHGLAGIEGAKRLLLLPSLLPFGFDQMKRILSATARHRAGDSTRKSGGLNRGMKWLTGEFQVFSFKFQGFEKEFRRLQNKSFKRPMISIDEVENQ